jgi:hypothetical protein
MWRRNFPLRAFSDTRTEIISNRVDLGDTRSNLILFVGS